jgi:hypothetical protein
VRGARAHLSAQPASDSSRSDGIRSSSAHRAPNSAARGGAAECSVESTTALAAAHDARSAPTAGVSRKRRISATTSRVASAAGLKNGEEEGSSGIACGGGTV